MYLLTLDMSKSLLVKFSQHNCPVTLNTEYIDSKFSQNCTAHVNTSFDSEFFKLYVEKTCRRHDQNTRNCLLLYSGVALL